MKHRLLTAAVLAGIFAGCASAPPSTPPSVPPAATGEPVPGAQPALPAAPPEKSAGLNLRGYPVAFRDGYTAGCQSSREGGRRRDEARYKVDMNYMMGWNDGYSICAVRK